MRVKLKGWRRLTRGEHNDCYVRVWYHRKVSVRIYVRYKSKADTGQRVYVGIGKPGVDRSGFHAASLKDALLSWVDLKLEGKR